MSSRILKTTSRVDNVEVVLICHDNHKTPLKNCYFKYSRLKGAAVKKFFRIWPLTIDQTGRGQGQNEGEDKDITSTDERVTKDVNQDQDKDGKRTLCRT